MSIDDATAAGPGTGPGPGPGPGRDAEPGAGAGGFGLRGFQDGDSVEEPTALLHRAYADHAAAGRVFFASYQSPRDTRHRLSRGECRVATRGGALVGTVTVSAPHSTPDGCPAPAGAGSFWQLAVDPPQRGSGPGHRLLELAA
ncbi:MULTISPECIES: GNAT family N-acetyltransferase [Streptomyces]|uniref:GNAT family N-acetyltransferase n=1 Tax=Streptomyces TaxID=1883 RepID=UPI00225896D5|nr:GNAT family N-acetyltransferase [Streptomyces sp. NBC_00160]MCX5308423.1 GNAT family N-acetyltransferase [Streptomyces sp. NBC_00160]